MKTLIETLKMILAEARRPSMRNETPHYAFCIAVTHVVLGAVLCWLALQLGLPKIIAMTTLPVLYWVVKEEADLRRGASRIDSLVDLAMITIGTLLVDTDYLLLVAPVVALLGVTLVRKSSRDLS